MTGRRGKCYKGGFLPHIDVPGHPLFITYRLADSIPKDVLNQLKAQADTDTEYKRLCEKYIDGGSGACWLKNPKVAQIVMENLKYHDAVRYRLIDWVIMPNHLHISYSHGIGAMEDILHGWKSFTAKKINKLIGTKGEFWHRDYYDRLIRNPDHFLTVRNYILLNPVKAGLVADPFDWPYSSIHNYDPSLKDGMRRWYQQWSPNFWDASM